MSNLKWEEKLSEVLNLYEDNKCIAELFTDEEGYWILNSVPLGFWNFNIELDEMYTKEEAKAYVEGLWKSDEWEGDFK